MNRRDIMGIGAGLAVVRSGGGASWRRRTRPARARDDHLVAPDGAQLYYTEFGRGRPLVFLHGWALASGMWDYQRTALAEGGLRCIAYDRRGHGRSAVPPSGYDFDTLADDLAAVLDQMNLEDVILIGHSMASGEIVRYLTRHGSGRVGGLVLVSPAATPCPMQSDSNPDGFPPAAIQAFQQQVLLSDFPGWADSGRSAFFDAVTSPALQSWMLGMVVGTSLPVALACNRTVMAADFRGELPRINSKTLVIHGDKDASAPLSFGRNTAALIPDARFVVYEGAPHGLFITHKHRLNQDILEFAKAP